MSRRISNETKLKRKLGEGEGADYRPWITTSEFNSLGTTSVIPDWKTGRGIHCLSQGEAMYYYILRWDDDNIDIREQFPLKDIELVNAIADKNHIMRPKDMLTTDFVITKADGSYQAISIKPNGNLPKRQLQKLCIEKVYWMSLGVPFKLVLKEDINTVLANNIRLMVAKYSPDSVYDESDAIRHKIATKELSVDLSSRIITNDMLEGYLQ